MIPCNCKLASFFAKLFNTQRFNVKLSVVSSLRIILYYRINKRTLISNFFIILFFLEKYFDLIFCNEELFFSKTFHSHCTFSGELYMIVEYCKFGNLQKFIQYNRKFFIDQINPCTGTCLYYCSTKHSTINKFKKFLFLFL